MLATIECKATLFIEICIVKDMRGEQKTFTPQIHYLMNERTVHLIDGEYVCDVVRFRCYISRKRI